MQKDVNCTYVPIVNHNDPYQTEPLQFSFKMAIPRIPSVFRENRDCVMRVELERRNFTTFLLLIVTKF